MWIFSSLMCRFGCWVSIFFLLFSEFLMWMFGRVALFPKSRSVDMFGMLNSNHCLSIFCTRRVGIYWFELYKIHSNLGKCFTN